MFCYQSVKHAVSRFAIHLKRSRHCAYPLETNLEIGVYLSHRDSPLLRSLVEICDIRSESAPKPLRGISRLLLPRSVAVEPGC